jgi:hypothetical protein
MRKPNLIIRMGAAYWDARVRNGDKWVRFDFRLMDKKARSTFHREFMNAFRAAR